MLSSLSKFMLSCLLLVGFSGSAHASSTTQECQSMGNYLLEQRIKDGDKEAQFYLGKKLTSEACNDKTLRRGLLLLDDLVANDHSAALFELGKLLIISSLTEAQIAEGTDFIRQSAQLGFAQAEELYGLLLIEKSQGSDERDQAMYWIGSAANKGLSSAAQVASFLYKHGMHGIEPDICIASLWEEAAFLIANPSETEHADASNTCH